MSITHSNGEEILSDKDMNTHEFIYLMKKHNINKVRIVGDNVLFYTDKKEIVLNTLEKEYFKDIVEEEINLDNF